MLIVLKKILLFNFFLSLFQISFVKAGYNQFTEIDSLGNWSIEQKFDSEKEVIECRASKYGYGTWFGERIRLDNNNQLIIPKDLNEGLVEVDLYLDEVRAALKNCRSGLIYLVN